MKSRIDELLAAKAKLNDDYEAEKSSHMIESDELRRQLNDMTNNSELEARTKNEKIKRLQVECDELRREKVEIQSQQRADESSRDRAEIESLRSKVEDSRNQLLSHERKIDEKAAEALDARNQAMLLKEEVSKKGALLANISAKLEDCKQQFTQLEAQNSKIKKAVG